MSRADHQPGVRDAGGRTLWILGGQSARPNAQGSGDTTILWDSFDDGDGCTSFPRLLEERFEELQQRFVEWRESLGRTVVAGRALIDFLRAPTSPRGSLWWATSFAVTAPESMGRVADVLKLLLLEELVEGGDVAHIRYVGSNAALGRVLAKLCRTVGAEFEHIPLCADAATGVWNKSTLYRRLPHAAQSILYLRAFVKRWLCWREGATSTADLSLRPELAIVTYFPNFDRMAATRGEFRSNYWGPLHDLIRDLGLGVRWILMYGDTADLTPREAVAVQQQLNNASERTRQEFVFAEAALTGVGLFRVVAHYSRLLLASLWFRGHRDRFKLSGSRIDFYPILRNDWISALRGSNAMYTAIMSNAMRRTVAQLPASVQRLFYLAENQSWEYLLLDAWRTQRCGATIGVAHVPNCTAVMAVRNRLSETRRDDPTFALADRIVTVSAPAIGEFRRLGWPAEILTTGEALRYSHLAGQQNRERHVLPPFNRHLLVVTGIMPAEARLQLALLEEAELLGGLSQYDKISVKPHPFCEVDEILDALSFSLRPSIVRDPLDSLFARVDVVYCASSTSASTEVAWVGLPLILSGAVDGVNLNPFMGVDGVRFAATPQELVAQLHAPARLDLGPDYFLLDPALSRWRTLLTEPLEPAA